MGDFDSMTDDIRRRMLEVIEEAKQDIQSRVVIKQVINELQPRSLEVEQAVLTCWHDLMRTGVLAWGLNASNPDPPFAHLTEHGRRLLRSLSRDPANPEGYLAAVEPFLVGNPVAHSYVVEALGTYNGGFHKATAVMVGAAAESLILALREEMVARLVGLGEQPSKELRDWRIKKVLDALDEVIEGRTKRMPQALSERRSSHWSSFTSQLRLARNDAGHPTSVDPVAVDVVHGALLIFPELAKLIAELRRWVGSQEF